MPPAPPAPGSTRDRAAAAAATKTSPAGTQPAAPPRPPTIPSAPSQQALQPSSRKGELPVVMPESLAMSLIATCEQELDTGPERPRAVRLHHELGWVFEQGLGDPERALEQYKRALELDRGHAPSLRGARRVHLATRRPRDALELFDSEVEVAPSPDAKATLLYEKGWWLEHLGDRDEAREAYRRVLELVPQHLSALKALERIDHGQQRWTDLAEAYERLANAVSEPPHRAALLVQRGSVAESRLEETSLAVELYESALKLDPRAAGALYALERLYALSGRYADLATLLERKAEQTQDASTRALALHHAARIHADRLGRLPEAAGALERALDAKPRDPLLLEDLAHLYELHGERAKLVETLRALAPQSPDPGTRLTRLHRIGGLLTDLDRVDEALAAYREALELAPAHVPTLQAIEPLYRKRGQWAELVSVWEAEAEAAPTIQRRVRACARIAEACESRLGRTEQTISSYEQVLRLEPSHVEAFKALTRLYRANERYRDLVQLYERVLDVTASTDHKIAYLFDIGALWEKELGDPSQAAQTYRRILQLRSDHLGAIHALQRSSEQAGKYEELVKALEMEIERTDDTAHRIGLLNRTGDVLLERLDNTEAAALRFRRVLEENEHDASALAGLGRIAYRNQRWEDLLWTYERELESAGKGQPGAELLCKMGELCETRLFRLDDAVAYYRRAADIAPGYTAALRALERLLRKQSAWTELSQVLEKEAEMLHDPSAKSHVLYRAGQVYEEQLRSGDEAARAYEASTEADPGNRAAMESLARVHDAQHTWEGLVRDLKKEAEATTDGEQRTARLLRRAEVLRHRIQDPDRAIEGFEQLLDQERGRLPALVALELLYGERQRWAPLADILRQQSHAFGDVSARVASLRELARVQQEHDELGDARTTLETVLEQVSQDGAALDMLELLAIQSRDQGLLQRVDQRIATSTEDTRAAAEHRIRFAHRLEQSDPGSALEAYRSALALDSAHLPAIRGLARTAEQLGDRGTLADAKRREAELTGQPKHAAELLVEEAELRLANQDEASRVIESLERALEVDPDHDEAAQRLKALRTSRGETQRLVDVLSNAATFATEPGRVAALWRRIGELHVSELADIASGVHAYKRALEAVPNDVSALQRLADLYVQNRQWKEAAQKLARIVEHAADNELEVQTRVRLAELHYRELNEPERAKEQVDAVLRLQPEEPRALAVLSDLQRDGGELDRALETAQKLAQLAGGRARGAAYVRMARIERDKGNSDSYVDSLCNAVQFEGPDGEAGHELRGLLQQTRVAKAYADALGRYVQQSLGLQAAVRGYLELARIQGDALEMPETAVGTLRQGLGVTSGHSSLAAELVRRLGQVGRYEDAIAEVQRALASNVTNAELWRELARTFDAASRKSEARLAMSGVVTLGEATEQERYDYEHTRGVPPLQSGAFDTELFGQVADEGLMSHPATRLLVSVQDAVPRLYPASTDQLGLPAMERLTSRSSDPVRMLLSYVSAVFNTKHFDAYVHDEASPLVMSLPGDPPIVIVSRQLERLPEPQQTFLVARVLSAIAGGVHAVDYLQPSSLGLVLAAATHTVEPDFGTSIYDPETLRSQGQKLRKALPWRRRRPMEEAATAYASTPPIDIGGWAGALQATATRAAGLTAGDLRSCIEALRIVVPQGKQTDVATFVHTTPIAADLMGFWVSDRALGARRALELL